MGVSLGLQVLPGYLSNESILVFRVFLETFSNLMRHIKDEHEERNVVSIDFTVPSLRALVLGFTMLTKFALFLRNFSLDSVFSHWFGN